MPVKAKHVLHNKFYNLKWLFIFIFYKMPLNFKNNYNLFNDTMKNYMKLYSKFEKKNLDLNFLLQCRAEKLLPNFINNVKMHEFFSTNENSRYKIKLLGRFIENTRRERTEIYCELYKVRLLLFSMVGIDNFRFCVAYIVNKFKYDGGIKLKNQTKKLNKLRIRFGVCKFEVEKTVINDSNYKLNCKELDILKYGPNHGIKTKINEIKFKSKIEMLYKQISKKLKMIF